MESMVSFTVRMRFAEKDREKISEVLKELAPASRQEPGCITYIPHWVDGEACTVLIYEQYKDEAALEAHRATPHFQQYAIGGLYQMMLERSVENLVAVI
jgi:quinol monooxygenase YgiN